MDIVHVKQGHDLRPAGAPSPAVADVSDPETVAVLPERFRFMRPRLAVATGDRVQTGTLLFTDKKNNQRTFLSPGAGTVTDIDIGPRRVVRRIQITLDDTETAVHFDTASEKRIPGLSRGTLISRLIAGGLWPCIRALPFRDIAPAEETPPRIVVSLGSREPFSPLAEIYIKGREDFFRVGVAVLQQLAPEVVVCQNEDFVPPTLEKHLGPARVLTVRGPYPAHDPGVAVFHTKTGTADNRAWFVDGQDVAAIGELMLTGRYPTRQTLVVAGPMVSRRQHLVTRRGAPLGYLVKALGASTAAPCRWVVGGILTGFPSSAEGYMGFYESALTLLPQGDEREFMALFKPGYHKPSYSRAFLSVFNKHPQSMNCNTHGEPRACIACNHCPPVCPVNILPQLTYKSLLANDMDAALAHGLLDCVECGLCTYVCPSKIDLAETIRQGKATYYSESAP